MAIGAMIGNLAVNLSMETAAFRDGATIAERRMDAMQAKFAKVGQKMKNVGMVMSAAITLPLIAIAKKSVDGAMAQRQAMGQVEAALKSMGDGAGRTSDQLLKMSDKLELRSLFDGDEILKKVTANLLTFGNVAGTNFDRAQQAAVDLSQRLGQDLQSSTVMIGKALNDPILGLSALRRVGIQFTADQEKMIKGMAEAGDVAGAQAIMLGELERQFGGAAAAAADTDPWRKAKVAMAQAGDAIGEKLIPFITKLADVVGGMLDKFNQLSPAAQNWVIGIGVAAAALGPLLVALGFVLGPIGKLVGFLAGTTAAAGAGGLVAKIAPLLKLLGPLALVAGAVFLIWQNWDTIGPALAKWGIGFQQRLEELGPKIDAIDVKVKDFMDGVNDLDRQLGLPTKDEFFESIRTSIAKNFTEAEDDLASFNAWIARTDAAIVNFARSAWTSFEDLHKRTQAAFKGVAYAAQTWLVDKLNAVWESAKAKIRAVKETFRDLYTAVVGNSYIPDMVDGIAYHFGRLQGEMVGPVLSAADQIMLAFRDVGMQALGGFGTAIADAITGAKSLAASFRDMARQIIHDLIAMTVRMLIFRAIGGIFGAPSIPVGTGNFVGPRFAKGGSGVFGGISGVDRNVLSLNGSPIAKVSKGEHFKVSPQNDNSQIELVIHSAPSPDAWTRIDNISATRAGQAVKVSIAHSDGRLKQIARPKLMGRG